MEKIKAVLAKLTKYSEKTKTFNKSGWYKPHPNLFYNQGVLIGNRPNRAFGYYDNINLIFIFIKGELKIIDIHNNLLMDARYEVIKSSDDILTDIIDMLDAYDNVEFELGSTDEKTMKNTLIEFAKGAKIIPREKPEQTIRRINNPSPKNTLIIDVPSNFVVSKEFDNDIKLIAGAIVNLFICHLKEFTTRASTVEYIGADDDHYYTLLIGNTTYRIKRGLTEFIVKNDAGDETVIDRHFANREVQGLDLKYHFPNDTKYCKVITLEDELHDIIMRLVRVSYACQHLGNYYVSLDKVLYSGHFLACHVETTDDSIKRINVIDVNTKLGMLSRLIGEHCCEDIDALIKILEGEIKKLHVG